MAGSQISTSVTIINSLLGFQAISLTDFKAADVADVMISAGSKVEIASAFFTFASDETPQASTWTAIANLSTVYITLTPAGSAGSQTLTAKWSSVVPVWSDSKQGFYASAASTTRYIAVGWKYSTAYTGITTLLPRKGMAKDTHDYYIYSSTTHYTVIRHSNTIEIGDWNMDSTTTVSVLIGYIWHNFEDFRSARAVIRVDGASYVRPLDMISATDFLPEGGISAISATAISLIRRTGGFFDGAAFDATGFNRGWITLEYERIIEM